MPHFKLNFKVVTLPLEQPFTIARGTKETVDNVIVTLSAGGDTGFGEAAPNTRYNEDAVKVTRFLEQLPKNYLQTVDSAEELADRLDQAEKDISQSMKSAKSAVEMAYLDWWGKKQAQPLWKLWKAPSNKTPSSSYTIGLDTIKVMQQKVKEAEAYPILKVKLGTARDEEIIKGIREVTDKPIRVDANEGWETLEQAKQQISFLADHGIELVEQAMPDSTAPQILWELKRWSPLPLVADESFKGNEKLDEIQKYFDGINIKLAKIGSLVKAREVIAEARNRGLEVMVGCMIESSLAIAAGALIGTWADYVDLDGNLLISDDPFEGLQMDRNKRVILGDQPGLGVAEKLEKQEE